MLSFHNDPAIKEKYLARVAAHALADEIIKGRYWEQGKGCAVGCTIHSNNHAAYETKLGLPEWLARLEDCLFEHLPNGVAKKFPRDFLHAIPVGVNLEAVKWRFCSFLLKENIQRVISLCLDETCKEQVVLAIRSVLAVHEKALATGVWDESAAWSAAKSTESAAKSAAWSAWSAAESAESAAKSAESAAKSAAESAAESAAAFQRYSSELLRLLREAC